MKTILQKIFSTLGLSFIISFAFAQPGTLDSSFGVNGKVTKNFGADYTGIKACAIQADGKIISVGNSDLSPWNVPNNLILAQYLMNGNLDSAFGINGKVTTTFNLGASLIIASTVLIQPDQKILIGGSFFDSYSMTDHFVMARYLTDGSLDSAFGVNGKVFTYIGPFPKENSLRALCLQQDGKILAGGYSDGYCLIRYKSNGIIDSSFAINGIFTNNSDEALICDISIQNDGKIVTAGRSEYSTSGFQIVRHKPNGNLDSSFGINGKTVTTFLGEFAQAQSLALLNNGSSIASGFSYNPDQNNYNMVLAKYKSTGALDSSFGINGKVITNTVGNYIAYSGKLLVQWNGKFIVAGNIAASNFIISRFNENGSIDSSFGAFGKATAIFEVSTNTLSGTLQKDGKIIAVGGPDFRLARFKGDEPITVSIKKNISITEGNTGTTPAPFKVILYKPATTDVFVNYKTKNLNAIAGSDYTAVSGTLRIKAGKVSGNIIVNVLGDNTKEPNERFALVLSNPVNAILGTLDSATCTIKNDDPGFAFNATSSENISVKDSFIKLYPNPVKDLLTIEGLQANGKTIISIIDGAGKVIAVNTTTASVFTQNIKQLPAGSYFVKIESGNKTETLKFIKQ
ncbi:T9SS type A sorting domain-containing protein [Panacibacter ginsenosidivorans]|uniref:T9SS type A sorting domain-containing protein n=1 Tax=Panacibacter ginsenosidivorans TaxID=1813871 RepID=A0A5B8V497_9BACT|nr:T9SS type A sorting domain-containing protein [Panacibacter ginsenosidivorans]QEC66200.1 T9SS type A sorting domain-containing protein [Panacibacter ginsenosidivorans]